MASESDSESERESESETPSEFDPSRRPYGVIGGLSNIAVMDTGPIGPMIFHLVMAASYHPDLPRMLTRIKLKVTKKYPLPWQALVTLLRPEAFGPKLRGFYQYRERKTQKVETFHYMIRKVWELPPPNLAEDSLSEILLGPLTNIPVEETPRLLRGIHKRLMKGDSPEIALQAWSSVLMFAKLRFPSDTVDQWTKELPLSVLRAKTEADQDDQDDEDDEDEQER